MSLTNPQGRRVVSISGNRLVAETIKGNEVHFEELELILDKSGRLRAIKPSKDEGFDQDTQSVSVPSSAGALGIDQA